jgi:Protein of unknown function (DUF2783)
MTNINEVTRSALRLEPAADPDAIYQLLVDAYDALDAQQSRIMETRLILLLANHIGDPEVIAQAVAAARVTVAAACATVAAPGPTAQPG